MPKRKRSNSIRHDCNQVQPGSSEGTQLTTRERLLEWNRFYSSGSLGVGVQCVVCKKWRQVLEFEETWQVPEMWECKMTVIDGKVGNCKIPSRHSGESFVDEEYVPGSLVWAKWPRFPWWPAMVEDDPDDTEYYRADEREYHVVFFNDTPQRAWVKERHLRPFRSSPTNNNAYTKGKPKVKKRLEKATEMAEKAAGMRFKERFENFSFAVVCKAKFPTIKRDDKVPTLPVTQVNETDDKVPTLPVTQVNEIVKKEKVLTMPVPQDNPYETEDDELKKEEIKKTLDYVVEQVIDLIVESQTTSPEESELEEIESEESVYDEPIQHSPFNIPENIKNKSIEELFSDVDSEDLEREEIFPYVPYSDPEQHERMWLLFHKWFETHEAYEKRMGACNFNDCPSN